MTHYEMVELLREKANVGYEEAKDALEATNWDLLDAIVLLEKQGKTGKNSSAYSTKTPEEPPMSEEKPRGSEFRDNLKRLAGWLKHLIEIGNRNQFVSMKNGKEALSISVTAGVALLCVSWPLTVILLVVGLFSGYRYGFKGPHLGNETLNNVMNKVNDAAETVKAEFSGDKAE